MWCSEIKCEISPQSEETGKPSLRKCHFKFKLKEFTIRRRQRDFWAERSINGRR